MGKAILSRALDPAAEQAGVPDADECAQSIRALLDEQRLHEAKSAAARAAEAHPGHPWLSQANRILNPDRIVARPARGMGRKREFAWLRQNAGAYRKHWVALLGGQLLACAETFQEVRSTIQRLELDGSPLLHYVD